MKVTDQDLLSDTPIIAVDLNIMEKNIVWMSNLAKEANINLRPHTKTHKSPYIAQLQLQAGAKGITVATLGEAEIMVNAGIHNILIAFPIVGKRKLERFKKLHERADLIVSLDHFKVAEGLNKVGEDTHKKVKIYVDVDTGLGRMGSSPERSIEIINKINELPYIEIIGLMSHTGHAYGEETDEGVTQIAVEEAKILQQVKEAVSEDINIQEISVGASATARVVKDIPHITEARPGMYVFNDRYVMGAGGATEDDCALTVFATVVARPYERRMIIDAGSKTLSSDTFKGGGYGKVKGHDNLKIERLSEEHGIIEVLYGTSNLDVGDVIEIIPNHVCPVVNLTDHIYGFRNGQFERMIPIEARGSIR